ncbi:MAG: Spy/CpxP family protein refolding chaperone [Gemmatimonadota bacterium]|nr:MAG: Spy/CpxP family protein refolding chaperone [Gemmatimonadota bacterium]
MRHAAQITLTALLSATMASTGVAQWGPRGAGYGFGMRSWVLYEGGVDSLATRIELTEQQRSQLTELAQAFREENSDAVERMNNMRAEIAALSTEDQQPTRSALARIAEKYDYPERDLRPALYQLHSDMSGIITVQQQRQLLQAPARGFAGVGVPPAYGVRGGGYGRFAPAPRFSQRGGRSFIRGGRWGQRPRTRWYRRPPLEP